MAVSHATCAPISRPCTRPRPYGWAASTAMAGMRKFTAIASWRMTIPPMSRRAMPRMCCQNIPKAGTGRPRPIRNAATRCSTRKTRSSSASSIPAITAWHANPAVPATSRRSRRPNGRSWPPARCCGVEPRTTMASCRSNATSSAKPTRAMASPRRSKAPAFPPVPSPTRRKIAARWRHSIRCRHGT